MTTITITIENLSLVKIQKIVMMALCIKKGVLSHLCVKFDVKSLGFLSEYVVLN